MKNIRAKAQARDSIDGGQPVRSGLLQSSSKVWVCRCLVGFILLVGSSVLHADPGVAQLESGMSGAQETVTVALNKSRVLKLTKPVSRVSVANPSIADILVLNARELYVVGKSLGTTNVVIWDKRKRVQRVIGLQVTHDLSSLKEKMFHYLPGEDIRIESAQGTIVLSGEVSSTQKMAAAMDLAKTYVTSSKKGKGGSVLNLMQVGGAQQVLLEVKVAEIARTLTRRMDIDFNLFYNGSSLKFGAVNGGAAFPEADFLSGGVIPQFLPDSGSGIVAPAIPRAIPGVSAISNTGAFLSYLGGDTLFQIVVDAARDKGLAKILAEPNLTTLSGQEAKFISGGEFPIPVSDDDGITIEYKEFGVALEFMPLVLDSGLISLQVDVAVSELQTSNSVAIATTATSGFFVPSLSKRAANATVEIPSGQTIAIAGLIQENLRQTLDNMPGLGDLPVLGTLFRSQEFIKGETELVIFVTPRLARPFDPELIQLPTDAFVEPNEVEFYLLGLMEGRGDLGPDKAGAEGQFGHEL